MMMDGWLIVPACVSKGDAFLTLVAFVFVGHAAVYV